MGGLSFWFPLFFFALAFRCLSYTPCMLWVGFWAPFIHYICYLFVLLLMKYIYIYIFVLIKQNYRLACGLMHYK